MTEDQFEKLMLDIIKGVFEEKNEKHFIYSRIFRKLMQSNNQNKLKIGKYLLLPKVHFQQPSLELL